MFTKKLIILFLVLLPFQHFNAQVKIGNNTGTIGTSSLLELETTNKAVLLTRVADTSQIGTPVAGMIIYDNSCNCLRVHNGSEWGGQLERKPDLTTTCTNAGFNASSYIKDQALSGATYVVRIINPAATATNVSLATSNLTLSGSSAGISVASVSPTSTTIAAGDSTLITYTLSGTPTSAAGTLTGAWSLLGMSCSKTAQIIDDAIYAELSTNQSDYNSAADGDWVAITATEYSNLSSNLSSVTAFGVAEANIKSGVYGNFGADLQYTYGHTNNPSPANVYVFAFKVATNIQITGSDDYVRLSTASNGTGFNTYGNALPTGSVESQVQYFVMKGASTLQSSAVYLGLTANHNSLMYYQATGVSGKYDTGSLTTVTITNFGWSMQALSTTSKQW